MSIEMLQAVIEGYEDRMTDLQLIGIHTGYWAGYYGNSRHKKPKALQDVIQKFVQHAQKLRQRRADPTKSATGTCTDVDVETFLRREEQFKTRGAVPR